MADPRRGGITAGELKDQLARDPVYQAALADRRERHVRETARLRVAERPVVEDLAAVGVDVESSWDLVNTSEPYPEAFPVLMKHLKVGGYPDAIMEGLARAMAVRRAGSYWDELRSLYLMAKAPGEADGLAVALSASAGRAQLEPLLDLVHSERLGESRIFLLRGLRRIGGERGQEELRKLIDDPVLGPEADAMIRRRRSSD